MLTKSCHAGLRQLLHIYILTGPLNSAPFEGGRKIVVCFTIAVLIGTSKLQLLLFQPPFDCFGG